MPAFDRASTARPAVALSALALMTLLAGCGRDGSGSGSQHTDPTPRTTTAADGGFPLSISRTGGIAGFADTVVIARDGTVQRKVGASESTCTLDPAALQQLSDAVASLAGKSAATTAEHPDELVVVLSSASGSARVGEGDLPAGAEAQVKALLDDAKSKQVCR